jgi:hypothetical protein
LAPSGHWSDVIFDNKVDVEIIKRRIFSLNLDDKKSNRTTRPQKSGHEINVCRRWKRRSIATLGIPFGIDLAAAPTILRRDGRLQRDA